ncbi:MAG: DUF6134 family protein [Alphaproteobacteria bacterium]
MLSRRRFALTGTAAGGALVMARPALADRADGRLLFDVYREGDRIGTHELRLRQEGDRIEADITIDLAVKFTVVTAYRYRHRNREVYEGEQLVSMSSRTNNNGEKLSVDVRREGDELVVDGKAGRQRVAGDLIPTTYWQPRSVERNRWIDSQNGRVVESEVTHVGTERIRYEGGEARADRYRLSGDLDCELWYGDEGWAKLTFEVQGSRISYRRRAESDVASLEPAVRS